MLRFAVRLILPFLLLLQAGCDRPPEPANLKSGVDLYNYYCKNCHEQQGPGANMEHSRSNPPLEVYQIIMLVKYGYRQKGQQHQMTTFSQLTDKQAEALANHVIQLRQASTSTKPSP